jgi:hypothetical protein
MNAIGYQASQIKIALLTKLKANIRIVTNLAYRNHPLSHLWLEHIYFKNSTNAMNFCEYK